MATIRLSINVEDAVEAVVEAAGAAVVTKKIELTFDTSNTINDAGVAGGVRPLKKAELMGQLDTLIQYVAKMQTLPLD